MVLAEYLPPQDFSKEIEMNPLFSLEKHAFIGDIPVMYAAWGKKVTAEEYKNRLQQQGKLTNAIAEMIDQSGFNVCYRYPDSTDPFSPEFQEQQIRNGVVIAESLIKTRGWENEEIEILSFASISSEPGVVKEIFQRLNENGYKINNYCEYDLACYGGFAPIADFSKPESPYFGKKALTVTVDSLTGNMIDPEDTTVWWMFGNGGAGMAWIPGVETEYICGTTIIDPDIEGAIKILASHAPAPDKDRIPGLPAGYQFAEGVNEESKKLFYRTKNGIYMTKATAPDNKVHMNPRLALAAFGKKFVELKRQNEKNYNKNHVDRGPVNTYDISHMPSLQIKYAQWKYDITQDLTELGLPKNEINNFFKLETIEEQEEFLQQFTMYKRKKLIWTLTELNNVSAGVSLIDLTEKALAGFIPLDTSIECNVYGIGVAYGNHFIQFHKVTKIE